MNRYEGSPAVIIERRKGTPDSPFSNMNESLVVSNDGKVILSEIPNELNRVIVTSDDIVIWFEVTEGLIPENGFKVDYINKIVTFNVINVGKQLHFKYLGEGNHYYSPNSIYTKLNEGSVVETLGGLIENSHEALDALERLDEKLNEVTQATTNAITATNDTKEVITEGNQVIVSANGKITEMDGKISEATSKMSELDTKLNQAETTISDVQQKSTVVEAIINDGQEIIDNAELLIDEVKSAGKFNLSTLYKKNNTVLDNGSTWIALQDTQNNPLPVLPIVENTYWRLAALHGSKGDKGDTGAALSILGKLTDPSQLPSTGQAGQAYTVNGELYVWSENLDAWENVGNIKGEKGDTGATGEDGLSAYEVAVVNGFVGTQEEWLASLKGEKGDADLTEINQEITNIKQTVTDNKAEVTEHLDQIASTEKLGHIKPDGTTITVDTVTGVASAITGDKDIYVPATSTDGENYNVTLEDVTELTNGLTIKVRPNMTNTSAQGVKLLVNSMPFKYITYAAGGNIQIGLFNANSIYTLVYNGSYFILQGDGFGLIDSLTSTAKHHAATANAVRQVNDKFTIPTSLTPAGLNGWITGGSYYFKDSFGIVHCYFAFAKGTSPITAWGTLLTQLPVNYRPTASLTVPTTGTDATGNTAYPASISVATDGKVSLNFIATSIFVFYAVFSFRTT